MPRIFITLLLAAIVSGCYHMRVNPEPLPVIKIPITKKNDVALSIVKRTLENEMQLRILDEHNTDSVLISAPHYFATETGFGQPAGGRRYYLQLLMQLVQENGQRFISVTPYTFEIRTSYAYNLSGEVKTLYKIYPYTEYPGMFDLDLLEHELKRISLLLGNALRDVQ